MKNTHMLDEASRHWKRQFPKMDVTRQMILMGVTPPKRMTSFALARETVAMEMRLDAAKKRAVEFISGVESRPRPKLGPFLLNEMIELIPYIVAGMLIGHFLKP